MIAKFFAAIVAVGLITPAAADPMKEVKSGSCLGFFLALNSPELLRPETLPAYKGIAFGLEATNDIEPLAFGQEFWKICRDSPSLSLSMALPQAIENTKKIKGNLD
ncbi:MAG: hypothetical protein MRY77_14430 [Rhodobacteraceae bacterium]|nr:hypothetical protein [Paracoccaceae bacterium]